MEVSGTKGYYISDPKGGQNGKFHRSLLGFRIQFVVICELATQAQTVPEPE